MRAALPLGLAILAASAAPAGAAIVPQDNIAGVKLGMTQGKILRVLGDPAITVFWLNARDRVESVTIAEVLGGDQ